MFRSQLDSTDDADVLYESEFEDRDRMMQENLHKTTDKDQYPVLFNNDNIFYDTLIGETCYDLEKQTSDSDEETDNIDKNTLNSTDEGGSSDENETDLIVEEDANDNEQKYELLIYHQRESFFD